MLKKIIVLGIVFILILMTIPTISGDDILYPKEDGPYNVFISGRSTGMGGGIYTCLLHFWPLWFLFHPFSIEWHYDEDYVFFVNGEKQNIEYPVQIDLSGFKGYGQSLYMQILIAFVAQSMGLPIPKSLVIGRCAEILVIDMR